ncbi:diacylglycerol kinase family protein [Pedobacter aquatilis]|uniref:diacylglycerol kinase family protein n=1 Tax=Pedobacter aquatilis TaxID=351343 RepID=UPI00293159D0|nr:diacylglycerol kinase family protein [Pedobacter aquatilis]
MKDKEFSIIARVKSFKHAFNGLKLFFTNEHNGWVHLLAAVLAIALSLYLNLSVLEWIAIISAIAIVFAAEIFNSAIEKLADVVTSEINPQIKIVKDLAAAGVLVTAILAVLIGAIIFLPKLF